jgi:hypothetical protein
VRHGGVQRRLRQVVLHQIVERLRLIRAGEGDGGLGAPVPHLTNRKIHKYRHYGIGTYLGFSSLSANLPQK